MYRTLSPGAIDVSVSFEEGVQLAARHGFDGLALDAGHLLEKGADAVRDILAEHGLKPGSFGLPVDILGGDDAYRASLARLEAVAKVAQQVGCSCASTYIFSWSDDKDHRANFAFHKERLSRPAAILAGHGIALGLEFLGPKTLRDGHPHTFIHTADGMLELCDAVGPNVGLLLDAWHWYTAGHDPADFSLLDRRHEAGDHPAVSHVGGKGEATTSHLLYLGDGVLELRLVPGRDGDLSACLGERLSENSSQALAAAGDQGDLTVKVHQLLPERFRQVQPICNSHTSGIDVDDQAQATGGRMGKVTWHGWS